MLATALLIVTLAQAQINLTIRAPETVDVCSSVWTPEIALLVQRPEKLEGAVQWSVVSAPPGVRSAIVVGVNDTAKLYLRGFCSGPEPDSEIVVAAGIDDKRGQAKIKLKRGQSRVLLVDDDAGPNNLASPSKDLSPSDVLYRKLLLDGDGLRSLAYDAIVVQKYANGPPLEVLQRYDAIVWYTAAEYGGNRDNTAVLSNVDLDNLAAFLAKGKCVILFSPGLVNNYQGYVKPAKGNEEQWTKIGYPFLSTPMGLKGARGLIHRFNEVDVESTDGERFHLAARKPVEAQISPVNPGSAKPLIMANLNPDNTEPRAVPCASANVSDRGTVVYIGFSFENIVDKVEGAFRIVVTPALGWGANLSANAIVVTSAAEPQPPGLQRPLPAIGGPSTPSGLRPKTSGVQQPAQLGAAKPGAKPGVKDEPLQDFPVGIRQTSGYVFTPASPAEEARFKRLVEIATLLQDAKFDGIALVTEAARLCGFSIWKEDRTRIAGPSAEPALHLALTDLEIRDYVAMFRAGHSVAYADLLAAVDMLYHHMGPTDSLAPFINRFLEFGPISNNMSARALAIFLRTLDRVRDNPGPGLPGEGARLDPIQTLLLLRVVTEEITAPARKALKQHRPQFVSLRWVPQEKEMAGYVEDGVTAVIVEITDRIREEMFKLLDEEKSLKNFGIVMSSVNAALSLIKFIATYACLEAKFEVVAPGEPLIRTQDREPGQRRTLVSRWRIDDVKIKEWMKEHRFLFAASGIDIDMPKGGPLAGVETEWQIGQSQFDTREHVIQSVGQADISKIQTDDQGAARIQVEGVAQPVPLNPKKAVPVSKQVKITITPQAKATEIKQDLVDALVGAAGMRNPAFGWLTPILESLYRMKWAGGRSYTLKVTDWVEGENLGELRVQIKESAQLNRKKGPLFVNLNRGLKFVDTPMLFWGIDKPFTLDEELIAKLPPIAQQQVRENHAKNVKLSRTPEFGTKIPNDAVMWIHDSQIEFGIDEGECGGEPTPSCTVTTEDGQTSAAVAPGQNPPLRFQVKMDLDAKTATLYIPSSTPVKRVTKYSPRKQGLGGSSVTEKEIFHGLKMEAPYEEKMGGRIVIPLERTVALQGSHVVTYFGTVRVPFKYGPNDVFSGTAIVSYHATRKVVGKRK